MDKRFTVDHGEIIHFAGARHLFPVASKDDPDKLRLARKDDMRGNEVRVGWPQYFVPFNRRGLVFLFEGETGRAVSRAEAETAGAAGEPKPTQ